MNGQNMRQLKKKVNTNQQCTSIRITLLSICGGGCVKEKEGEREGRGLKLKRIRLTFPSYFCHNSLELQEDDLW